MVRRDQLTYDVGQESRPKVPWKSALILAVVVAVGALLLTWTVMSSRVPRAAPVSSPETVGPTASASPSPTSPSPAGSDAQEGLGAPEGSQRAASVFVRAWLDPNAKTRKPILDQVATPALAEQLMLTDPLNIPRTRPRGAPILDDASTYSAQFTQTLSSGMKIHVYLVADPDAQYQWLAASVDQA